MAVSGLLLLGFVVAHMAGNLKVFQGAEKLNGYAEFLREVGAPIFGHGEVLWIFRIGLILAVAVHIVSAIQLTAQAKAARPIAYRRSVHLEDSYASRTMRWGGVIIAAFITYHLLHLTWGTVHNEFVTGDVYHNMITAFQVLPITLAYAVATGFLGLHLYHGVWSALQTLGINHSRLNGARIMSAGIAIVIVVGYLSAPFAILFGVIG